MTARNAVDDARVTAFQYHDPWIRLNGGARSAVSAGLAAGFVEINLGGIEIKIMLLKYGVVETKLFRCGVLSCFIVPGCSALWRDNELSVMSVFMVLM